MAPTASRRALRSQPRTTRGKPAFSYAESSDDGEINSEKEVENNTLVEASIPHPQKVRNTKVRTAPKKTHQHSSSFDSSHSEPSAKRRKQSRSNPPKSYTTKSVETQSYNISQSRGVVPPWQLLPYDILLHIFRYASYPLYDAHYFQPLPSGSWLLRIARLCREFAEPAFTVLYSSPPLVPMEKAHKLVGLLKADPARLMFRYRQKVESLRIDVGQVATYSMPGSGYLDIFSFVKDLPRLKALEFYHQKDMSPYRNLEDSIKWTYPESLFDALEYINPEADPLQGDKTSVCRLESWRWSSRLAGKKYPIESLRQIHLKPSFFNLQTIAFVNYQVPPAKKGEEEPAKHEEILADALSVLRNLKHLVFESSTLLNSKLLPLLPKSLENLELINCWDVHADEFAEFLVTHGSQFRSLTLNHNLSLNLSFLPILGTACPKLEILHMNLAYFNMHSFYHDSDPNYEHLILPNQVPVWPSTLQILELTQLRKWDTEACEMFFSSLLDSAAALPDLRRLTVQAILNTAWRDRATFRDRWTETLERVFKRVSSPPRFDVVSRAYGHRTSDVLISPKLNEPVDAEAVSKKRESLRSSSGTSSTLSVLIHPPRLIEQPKTSTHRSTRTSTRQLQSVHYAESSDDSDDDEASFSPEPEESARELARRNRANREVKILKQTAGFHGLDLPTSPPQTESESDAVLVTRNRKGKAKEVVQGTCEVVDIRIDNLRPRETMFTEANFLDEEQPGDGDWNGDDDAMEDYAW
jgi:hypothetical protein